MSKIKDGYSVVEIHLCKFNGCDIVAKMQVRYPEEASIKMDSVKRWFDGLVLGWNKSFFMNMKDTEKKEREDHEWEQLLTSIKTDNVAHHTVALIQMADMIKKLLKEKQK